MTVVDFMAQPSTHFEPLDPMPLRRRALTEDEFNRLSAQHPTKQIEIGVDHAALVVNGVRYTTEISEAP